MTPLLRLEGWRAEELRLFWAPDGIIAELKFTRNNKQTLLILKRPVPQQGLLEIMEGIDFLEIVDRNSDDGFHRDFGRYRVEYFIDDPFYIDADDVEFYEDF